MEDKRFVQGKDGIWKIMVKGTGTRRRGVSTGQKRLADAIRAAEATGVDRLQQLAESKAVTEEAIDIITGSRRMTFGEVRKEFDEWLPSVLAQSTARDYSLSIKTFACNMNLDTVPLREIGEKVLSVGLNYGSPTMIVVLKRLQALRKFYHFVVARGYQLANPAQLVAARYEHMTIDQLRTANPVVPFTEEQYMHAVAALCYPWRERTIIGWCCGYRICDVMGLEWASFGENHITIFPQKTRRMKAVELPLDNPLIGRPELKEAIAKLMTLPRHSDYVWPTDHARFSQNPGPWSVRYTTRLNEIGIVGPTFRSLRTAFMIRLEASGIKIGGIAQMAGHSRTATTQIYLDKKYNLPAPAQPREPLTYCDLELAALGG
jgi:integrase